MNNEDRLADVRLEAVARAICFECEDDPDGTGDCRGNDFRWQDYVGAAKAAMSALAAHEASRAQREQIAGEAVSVPDGLLERFRIACRALIQEKKVYGEDVKTLREVIDVLASAPTAPAGDGGSHE